MSELMNLLLENGIFRSVCKTALILAAGILVIRILGQLLKKALERSRLEKAAHVLITSLTNTALYILLGLMAASALGIDVTGIVALASVLTLALSLALQNLLTNIIGGFTILYTHPFHSGDLVEIAGQVGTVQEINMSYTRLATPDNKVIFIPNSSVVAAQIINYSTETMRRVEVKVSAAYDVPAQQVIDALVQAGTVEQALTDPAPQAVVAGYTDTAVQYSLRVWVNTQDYWDVHFQVHRLVKQIFDDGTVTLPYPHVHIHQGDR